MCNSRMQNLDLWVRVINRGIQQEKKNYFLYKRPSQKCQEEAGGLFRRRHHPSFSGDNQNG